jgi:Cu2+-exporting ATPase
VTADRDADAAAALPRIAPGGSGPACRHCGSPLPIAEGAALGAGPVGDGFCCAGCAAAYDLVRGLGLESYYRRRTLDPRQRPLIPDEEGSACDLGAYVREGTDGACSLSLMVDGLHCAACVWLIESVLSRQPDVTSARVNMTTRRLGLRWRGGRGRAAELIAAVGRLGYRLIPFESGARQGSAERTQRELLRAMAVAGFAAGNVMLLSVAVWAGHAQGMGPATRGLLHWISALIALPAIAYAGRSFFRSAVAVLRHGRTNMDVPISIGVILTAAMSLHETIRGAEHAYFDSAVGLLFFLLIGRTLDRRARGVALATVEYVLALGAAAVTIEEADGRRRRLPPAAVEVGMRVAVAAGERIAVDGRIVSGHSSIDTSLIDGEAMPKPAGPGGAVFAGCLNLENPLVIEATAVGEGTLLAEIARLVEAAENQKSRFVALADKVSRAYAPVVHSAALLTFLGWLLLIEVPWQQALLNAIAVLIITCPCALALAIPVVQVVAISRLLRRGVLVKSGTALERLAAAEMIAFDKTGTLTVGRPELVDAGTIEASTLTQAAGLAARSRHPLARALVRSAEARGLVPPMLADVREVAGQGLEVETGAGPIRLGSRRFCGVAGTDGGQAGSEIWLARPHAAPIRFAFADQLRSDAADIVQALSADGYQMALLSGDRAPAVATAAGAVGIADFRPQLSPLDKVAHLRALADQGRRVLMVGDGLNDAPALAAAHVSLSPATAADIAQTAADVVFQGDRLEPVRESLIVAKRARILVIENLALSLAYNALTVPLAVAGLVTPLIAAIAMSLSSLIVILNALRLSPAWPFKGGTGAPR